MADQVLKITESIKISLVPGTNRKAESKNFTWEITEFSSEEMTLQFVFNSPDSVSQDSERPDNIIMGFTNTESYLVPKDESLSPVKSGFKVVIILPPQL